MKINSISSSDPSFPVRLREIPNAPKQLFYRGELPDDTRKFVSIIGTRKPTPYGTEVTKQLSRKLAERGVVIISGLALGVDGLAHQGALAANGTTIAAFAHGLDQISPRSNIHIAEQMLETGGALISEFEPGTPPYKVNFLKRNRLVSGLCDALIITEASSRSGTFNTVSHALEQGRDVYAVPGPITSPMSSGSNQLIAQGAIPITDIDEFVDRFAPAVGELRPTLAYSPAEQMIIDLIKQGSRDGEELQTKSQLDAGSFAETLTMLELRGAVRALGANQWSL
jgi:DNA processing protein